MNRIIITISMFNLSLAHALALALVLALGFVPQSACADDDKADSSLYARIGGDSTIMAIVDDFTSRLLADSTLKRLVVGSDEDSRRVYKRLAKNQLCAQTGGPCLNLFNISWLKGRAYVTIEEWRRLESHFKGTMSALHIGSHEADELMVLVEDLKAVILIPPKTNRDR